MLSDKVNELAESATIAMASKSRELKAQGKDIISLSLGEPDFNTPDFVKAAAKEGVDQNYSKYMPVPGYLDLRESISQKFKRDNGLDYAADQIVVSTGAKQSIMNVVMAPFSPVFSFTISPCAMIILFPFEMTFPVPIKTSPFLAGIR